MRRRFAILSVVFVLFGSLGSAKGKAKDVLPFSVLRARTVAVIIDPDAGTIPMPIKSPEKMLRPRC